MSLLIGCSERIKVGKNRQSKIKRSFRFSTSVGTKTSWFSHETLDSGCLPPGEGRGSGGHWTEQPVCVWASVTQLQARASSANPPALPAPPGSPWGQDSAYSPSWASSLLRNRLPVEVVLGERARPASDVPVWSQGGLRGGWCALGGLAQALQQAVGLLLRWVSVDL